MVLTWRLPKQPALRRGWGTPKIAQNYLFSFLLQVPFLELSGLLEDQFLADMDIPDSLKSDSTDTKSPSGFVKSALLILSSEFRLQVAGFSAESLMMVEEQESPRIIKTHLSLEMLPRQAPDHLISIHMILTNRLWKSEQR